MAVSQMAFISSRAHLLGADGGAQAHDAAGGHKLDEVGTVLDVVAHWPSSSPQWAVGSIAAHKGVGLDVGVVVAVRMAAGGADSHAADHQTGAGKLTAVDGIADSHIQIAMVAGRSAPR